jgi:hypothetical protein
MIRRLSNWPFVPDNSAIVAGWGFWLTILGLALTLIGFCITWIQLKKTKTAAEAASAEARRIKLAVATYDAAGEASKAIAALESARRHLRNAAWADVADSYDMYRRSINSINNIKELDPSISSAIAAANKYVSRLCNRIEEGLSKGNVEVDAAKTISMMRQHDELASQISTTLQRDLIQ